MFVRAGLVIVFAGLICAKTLEKHFIANTDKPVSFLLFSDIHLDLMYKKTADKHSFCRNANMKHSHIASYGRIGCDTPLALLQNALSAMKQKTKNLSKLDFILVPGNIKNSSNLKLWDKLLQLQKL
jgi:protein-arginine kinase activator protein McsA